MRRILLTATLTAGLVAATAIPATATIHEIVASFCASTHEVSSPTGALHDPPGLSPEILGGTSNADNVAQPLLASGALEPAVADGDETVVLGGPPTEAGDRLLVVDEDNPNVKLLGTGLFFYDPAHDVYVEIPEPDPDFPAFANCPNVGH